MTTSRFVPGTATGERSDREFHRLVNEDFRDRFAAGPANAVLSRPENRVRRLYTLVGMCESIKIQNGLDKDALPAHPDKPAGGGPTPGSYADAKRKMLECQRSRDRAMQAVTGRIAEVRHLTGTDLVPARAIGEVVGDPVTVLRCIRNSLDRGARRRVAEMREAYAEFTEKVLAGAFELPKSWPGIESMEQDLTE